METKEGTDRGKVVERIKEEENRGSRNIDDSFQDSKEREGSRLLHPSLMGVAKQRGEGG